MKALLANTDSDTVRTSSQEYSSLLPEKQHSSSEESPSLSIYSIANVCLHHFLPRKCLILSSPLLCFVLWANSGILQPLQLQTLELGERSQLLGGVSRVQHWETQAEGILEQQRGTRLHTSAHESCHKHASEKRGRRPCTTALHSSLTPWWNEMAMLSTFLTLLQSVLSHHHKHEYII